MEETTNQPTGSEESSGLWAWVVTGIVVVVAIFGFYAWPKQQAQEENQQPVAEENEVDVQAQALEQVSPSDEVDAIETDLKNTDLNNLDKELNNIESEINAQK